MARLAITGQRPPSYVSKATLAAELDIGESTVDDLVKRGALPKPIRIGGSVRWDWELVKAGLNSAGPNQDGDDPFLKALTHETVA